MGDVEKELGWCRESINDIDDTLVELFIQRMEIAGKIGNLKKEAGLPVLNVKREEQVKERIKERAPEAMRSYVSELYDTIFALSKRYQETQTNSNGQVKDEL